MVDVHVVRVFTGPDGRHGNPLGVVLDTAGMDDERRQAIATAVNFSETVFVDDVAQARLRIFTPAQEIPLAGHPLVGTSWLLTQVTGAQLDVLRPLRAANVATWVDAGVTWIRARLADAPPWNLVQLPTPSSVEALPLPAALEHDLHEFWAWQDEAAGLVRARVFASRYGVPEDEATGSSALRLVDALRRPLVITQGQGSVIHARPAEDRARAEVGGLVIKDELRRL